MGSKIGEYPYENSWPLKFSSRRDPVDVKREVETIKEIGAEGDDLDIFFTDAPCEVELLKNLRWGVSFKDVQLGTGRAGHRKAIWLDDRSSSSSPNNERSGQARPYENPLTATALSRILMRSRFKHDDLPEATRRLIYIADLDPASIRTLIATASCHQTPALRNTIYKHLKFETSIAVKLRSAGFLNFQLDLHLPFFLLKKSTPPKESNIYTKPPREWIDLSFLKLDTPEPRGQEPEEVWGVQEAQISCVVTGSDDWWWVAYGFVDTEIDGLLSESTDIDLKFDQIAGRGKLDANIPIWRPREYWLKVFEVRIKGVREQWEYLVFMLERGVKQYRKEHPFTLSRRSGTIGEQKKAFDWTIQMMDLLRKLDIPLSNTIEAWKSFNSLNGDIGYFRDANSATISPNAHRSLLLIKETFRQLEGCRKTIIELNKSCSNFSKALKLRLSLESREAADKNEFTAEFMVSILYPIALAAAIFSMQQDVIPFDLNPKSFAIAVFILIAMIYTVRVFIRHAALHWLSLHELVTLWTRMRKLGWSDHDTSATSAGVIGDEERNNL